MMKKTIFLAIALISLTLASRAQNAFLDELDTIDKGSTSSVADLINIITKSENGQFLNPKEKTGQKNLAYCLTNLITYSQYNWLQLDQINSVLESFGSQGMDFSEKGKQNISGILLQKFVYGYKYEYQNIGMLIYEALLVQGFDPYFLPDKKSVSMFDYAIQELGIGSEYFDILVKHVDFNTYAKELEASPYLWLSANPTEENLAALQHLVLYDKDLD